MLVFDDQSHSYKSIDVSNDVPWISVTTLVSLFKTPFDAQKIANKSSVNPNSKWYGIPPEQILKIWDSESKRSTDAGKWYHGKRETDLLDNNLLTNGLSVQAPVIKDGKKYAPTQKLFDNTIYPEHLTYSFSDQVCGQSDKVEVKDKKVHITDYKTIKELKTSSYVNWEGISQKMLAPIDHLEDCHLIHYSLQLSFYLYMILKHNPQLSPGNLIIEHIKFKLKEMDKHGFPIYLTNDLGEFVVEDVVNYNVPYLKSEVKTMLDHFKNNKEELLKRKK